MVITKYIAVDGILSAGKSSTLGELVKKFTEMGFTCGIIDEPVDGWVKSGLLSTFYSDVSRYGYLFQTKVFHDRIRECQKGFEKYNGNTHFVFVERTIYTDTIFMEQLYKSGKIQQIEWDCYQEWCSVWEGFMPFNIDLDIYLRPSLNVAMDRLRKRNREGENGITEEYQQNLFTAHDEKFRSENCPFKVLEWDSEQNIYDSSICEKLYNNIISNL